MLQTSNTYQSTISNLPMATSRQAESLASGINYFWKWFQQEFTGDALLLKVEAAKADYPTWNGYVLKETENLYRIQKMEIMNVIRSHSSSLYFHDDIWFSLGTGKDGNNQLFLSQFLTFKEEAEQLTSFAPIINGWEVLPFQTALLTPPVDLLNGVNRIEAINKYRLADYHTNDEGNRVLTACIDEACYRTYLSDLFAEDDIEDVFDTDILIDAAIVVRRFLVLILGAELFNKMVDVVEVTLVDRYNKQLPLQDAKRLLKSEL